MELTIRTVREEDAESIVELLNPIIREGMYTVISQEFSIEDQIGFIRGFPDRGVFNVAVCSDTQRVIGFQDVQPMFNDIDAFKHVGEISTFISLNSHRKGVGKALSQVTFQEMKDRGYKKIMAMIRADNPGALDFYASQGFEVIGKAKKHAFINGKYIDEVLTEKFLD